MIRAFALCARVLVGILVLVGLGAGCVRPAAVLKSTPAAPVWQVSEVRETLRALRTAASVLERSTTSTSSTPRAARVADYLSERMRRYGVQPGAEAHRLHYLLADSAGHVVAMPLMVGLIAGRDPMDEGAVLVYAPLVAERAAAGPPRRAAAALELARVVADLGHLYRFPAHTLILVIPVGSDHGAALRAYGQQPVWPLEKTRAVLTIGASEADAEAWRAVGMPSGIDVYDAAVPMPASGAPEPAPEEQVVALARRGYAWLLPRLGAGE